MSAFAAAAATVRLPHRGGAVRVAQVTDTHLEHHSGGRLLGMDTDQSLAHVLALLRAAPQLPDLVLATGDLANHGSDPAYARVREQFDGLGVPWFWLPGNHDDIETMQRVLGRGRAMVRAVGIGNWQIVLLDSTIPGEVGGCLGEAELELLERLLGAHAERHALVCLHHQPVPIGCAWLDEQRVTDGAAFLEVLDRHPQVRAVVWGHVHQEFSRRHRQLLLMSAPSTCIQFAPLSASFRVDECAPGMRWLELGEDGAVATRIERVEGIEFHFDRDSAGYL